MFHKVIKVNGNSDKNISTILKDKWEDPLGQFQWVNWYKPSRKEPKKLIYLIKTYVQNNNIRNRLQTFCRANDCFDLFSSNLWIK